MATALIALVRLGLSPGFAQVPDEQGGSKDIVLTDPDHPLNGAWQVVHGAGTVVCPQMTMPIPAGSPESVRITVHDAGARLEATTPEGRLTLRRVGIAEWESESTAGAQVLRRTLRSDDAALMARAVEGDATIYEGTQTPTAGMTIHYILGWVHAQSDVLGGHLTSAHQGCKITRPFKFRRAG
jgi:hypothetical protein